MIQAEPSEIGFLLSDKMVLSDSDGVQMVSTSNVVDFPDNDFGLLNYGKLYIQLHHHNGSPEQAMDFSAEFPSQYNTVEIIILAIVMTIMMIIVVIGNMLVIIAIATEHSLSSVQNWFIASLAFADLSLGLIIMPFSLAYELLGYWMFGSLWCDIHGALDVLLSTSSIMNICLISLDRYWSITRALDYLTNRTQARVMIYIMAVWALSALISIPPLLGWKKDPDRTWFYEIKESQDSTNLTDYEFLDHLYKTLGEEQFRNFTQTLEDTVFPKCQLSEDTGYVLYSAFGSFYIPSCIMVFVYIQIYFAARARARRHIKPKGSIKKKENYSMAPVKANPPAYKNGLPLSSNSIKPDISNLTKHDGANSQTQKLLDVESNDHIPVNGEKPDPDAECSVTHPTDLKTHQTVTKDEQNGCKKGENHLENGELPNGAIKDSKSVSKNNEAFKGTNNNDDTSELGELSSDCGHPTGCITLKTRILPKLRLGRRLSKEAREMIDIGKTPVKSVSRNLQENATKDLQGNPEKEKRRIARKKERRATLILGMIMGSFIACWFPFFFLYSISPVCPVCEANPDSPCCVWSWGFSVAFWLGYSNSAFNPVIYTVFNNDFRRAFKKILFK